MTVRISGLAALVAGGGLAVAAAGSAAMIAGLDASGKGTRARDLLWFASCYAAGLGMIAFALAVTGQLFLWISAAAGWPR